MVLRLFGPLHSVPCFAELLKDIEENIGRKVGGTAFKRIPCKHHPLKTSWDTAAYRKVEMNAFGILLSQRIRITFFSFHVKIYSGL